MLWASSQDLIMTNDPKTDNNQGQARIPGHSSQHRATSHPYTLFGTAMRLGSELCKSATPYTYPQLPRPLPGDPLWLHWLVVVLGTDFNWVIHQIYLGWGSGQIGIRAAVCPDQNIITSSLSIKQLGREAGWENGKSSGVEQGFRIPTSGGDRCFQECSILNPTFLDAFNKEKAVVAAFSEYFTVKESCSSNIPSVHTYWCLSGDGDGVHLSPFLGLSLLTKEK